MASKRVKPVQIPSAKSEDQPAKRKMLSLVRTELIQKMDSGFNRMESRFTGIESRFTGIEAQFTGIDGKLIGINARFTEMESRFTGIESRFDAFDARFSRMEFLLEEQSSNNRIVLEGLQGLWQKHDLLETKVNSLS